MPPRYTSNPRDCKHSTRWMKNLSIDDDGFTRSDCTICNTIGLVHCNVGHCRQLGGYRVHRATPRNVLNGWLTTRHNGRCVAVCPNCRCEWECARVDDSRDRDILLQRTDSQERALDLPDFINDSDNLGRLPDRPIRQLVGGTRSAQRRYEAALRASAAAGQTSSSTRRASAAADCQLTGRDQALAELRMARRRAQMRAEQNAARQEARQAAAEARRAAEEAVADLEAAARHPQAEEGYAALVDFVAGEIAATQ